MAKQMEREAKKILSAAILAHERARRQKNDGDAGMRKNSKIVDTAFSAYDLTLVDCPGEVGGKGGVSRAYWETPDVDGFDIKLLRKLVPDDKKFFACLSASVGAITEHAGLDVLNKVRTYGKGARRVKIAFFPSE